MPKLRIFAAITALAMLPSLAQAQDSVDTNTAKTSETRYVTDLIFTPVRTGPGGDYRIINKGLPSGTEVTYYGLTEDGVWAEIETKGGTRGYLRAQYLQANAPRGSQVNALEATLAEEVERTAQLQRDLDEAMAQLTSTDSSMSTAARELEQTRETLAEVKRVSANAIQLDQMTKSLTGKLEDANARNDLLKLENARLQDRISSNRTIEVVVLIALGIMIALLVPRLSVKRRRNDGWR
ncbi:TIGR04211 family SH3 domain-containing protein [Luminiphilus sp.]|nr:TIGR04211 family SH3 domain-containing protein [Luminiphilus sp.]MDB2586197.1 TIGR04211 family SH3 domain-containing protein [Luminiphilus sp.]MDB2660065.1 TIGR04211 family SH3 domain-containing protein [Luminiphilus sp.]MDB2667173.1 TIGR04211 family SH3 domain-containing protein [Luminiphilus sp.]MDB3934345.1 TIGR04211 family SH3 domain-containing protein [Luminiphilus sp.]